MPYLLCIKNKYSDIKTFVLLLYQRSNQKPKIEEGQTIQCPKERRHKQSSKITQKTKDRVTRIPQKPVVMSDAPEGQVVPDPFVLKYFGVYDLTDIRFVRCISYANFVKRAIDSLASKILHS